MSNRLILTYYTLNQNINNSNICNIIDIECPTSTTPTPTPTVETTTPTIETTTPTPTIETTTPTPIPGGLCCYCHSGFYYYVSEEIGGETREFKYINGNGQNVILIPQGVWFAIRIYSVNGQSVAVYPGQPAPPTGTFITKFVSTGLFKCRYADFIWNNSTDLGPSGIYSQWYRDPYYTGCEENITQEECGLCTEDEQYYSVDRCGTFTENPNNELQCCLLVDLWTTPPPCGCAP